MSTVATLAVPASVPDRRVEFDALVAEHFPRLRSRAVQLCHTHLDPDDLIQDALERAYRAFGSLRDRDRARPWLLRIVSNTFLDAIRRQRSRPSTVPLDPETDPAADEPTEPLAWEHIDAAMLRAAVERLPDDMRDTYRMSALDGMDYAAIAAALGIPKATVGTRLLRARRRLRELLAADARGTR